MISLCYIYLYVLNLNIHLIVFYNKYMIYKVPPINPWEITSKESDILLWSIEENFHIKDVTNSNCVKISKDFSQKIFIQVEISESKEFSKAYCLDKPQMVIRIKDNKIVFRDYRPRYEVILQEVRQMADLIKPIAIELSDSKVIRERRSRFLSSEYKPSTSKISQFNNSEVIHNPFKAKVFENNNSIPNLKKNSLNSENFCSKKVPKNVKEKSNFDSPIVKYVAKTGTVSIFNLGNKYSNFHPSSSSIGHSQTPNSMINNVKLNRKDSLPRKLSKNYIPDLYLSIPKFGEK